MNLQTQLEPNLWEAIRTSIEDRRFSNAILDAVHFLSDRIRDRSGLEGDGVALVGAAFGGASPKLKVNRLQTESDQNIQKGIESMLRGIYQAIRNPRSHGTHSDEERDAVAIIIFLDYLLRIVDKSKTQFSVQSFVGKILDPDFVSSERYANLLIEQIPQKKRLATCQEIISRRRELDGKKVRPFFDGILRVMDQESKAELWGMLSEELSQTNDDDTIIFVLSAFPEDVWKQLSEIARLRIENKLVQSIKRGEWSIQHEKCGDGNLGVWAMNIAGHFTLKDDLWNAVFAKLSSDDYEEQEYAFKYFASSIRANFTTPSFRLIMLVQKGLRAGDKRFKDLVDQWTLFDSSGSAWASTFTGDMEKFEERSSHANVSGDVFESGGDVPF